MARIMVVDDAAFMRMMIKEIVLSMGHEIAGEASNGIEAVKLYPKLAPDLVTMDITMPDMDGVTAVKKIRRIDLEANIIICSAMGQKAMVMEAILAGAKDFLVKPLQHERVVAALMKAL